MPYGKSWRPPNFQITPVASGAAAGDGRASGPLLDRKGRTVYTPPGPKQAKPLTVALLSWVNGKKAGKQHPIVVNAVAHHRLVSIHSFADGNGRVKSPDIEAAFKLTRARVGQIIKPLVEAGLVVREGRTRAATYRLP